MDAEDRGCALPAGRLMVSQQPDEGRLRILDLATSLRWQARRRFKTTAGAVVLTGEFSKRFIEDLKRLSI